MGPLRTKFNLAIVFLLEGIDVEQFGSLWF